MSSLRDHDDGFFLPKSIESYSLFKGEYFSWDSLSQFPGIQITALLIGSILILLSLKQNGKRVPGAPIHGHQYWWEPTIWSQMRFVFGAQGIVASGYRKVT